MPKSDRYPDINPPTQADIDRGNAFARDLRVRLGLPAEPPRRSPTMEKTISAKISAKISESDDDAHNGVVRHWIEVDPRFLPPVPALLRDRRSGRWYVALALIQNFGADADRRGALYYGPGARRCYVLLTSELVSEMRSGVNYEAALLLKAQRLAVVDLLASLPASPLPISFVGGRPLGYTDKAIRVADLPVSPEQAELAIREFGDTAVRAIFGLGARS